MLGPLTYYEGVAKSLEKKNQFPELGPFILKKTLNYVFPFFLPSLIVSNEFVLHSNTHIIMIIKILVFVRTILKIVIW